MTKKKKPTPKTPSKPQPAEERVEETFPEAVASICSILVIGLFILTFLGQNFVIPSGSMEKTLLVGDHLLVDRITFAPPEKLNPVFQDIFGCDIPAWMPPLIHYREPKRGDIVVFIKPVAEPEKDADGNPQYLILVKRLIGIPGDRIHLRNGIVILNGAAQEQPHAQPTTPENHRDFLDEFPSVKPSTDIGATEAWSVDFPNHIYNGELVVPPGHYFMMGDNRHNSLDSRYWGFVPRENIVGRPLFNYWSFVTPEDQYNQTGIGNAVAWMGHVALHFFTETRWSRTLHRVK
ncbi:MAG: signal peptidase I [Terracidiphilus sp.]|jgi:signal peptidase I